MARIFLKMPLHPYPLGCSQFLSSDDGHECCLPRSAPVLFFPVVHEKMMKLWMAPLMARSCSSPSSVLTILDGGTPRGYMDVTQVERAVAVKVVPPVSQGGTKSSRKTMKGQSGDVGICSSQS